MAAGELNDDGSIAAISFLSGYIACMEESTGGLDVTNWPGVSNDGDGDSKGPEAEPRKDDAG